MYLIARLTLLFAFTLVAVLAQAEQSKVISTATIELAANDPAANEPVANEPSTESSSTVDFVWKPPGQMISVGSHRLHIECIGTGNVTVLFEAGLGGSSLEWQHIQQQVADKTVACVYDRGGYGWSDATAGNRSAQMLARETNLLLNNLSIRGPLILIGHSFGGFVVRELANLRDDKIVGLILVDASHEKQVTEFERIMPIANMPTGRSFVISPMSLPDGLDPETQFKIATFGRMRKTYHAVHAEINSFRHSAVHVSSLPRPVSYPIVVLRRGRNLFEQDEQASEKSELWKKLQIDLASLSTTGRLEVATQSGHHIHLDEPQLLVDQIETLLDNYQSTL